MRLLARKILFIVLCIVLVIGYAGNRQINAEEAIEDSGGVLYSLGEDGEAILVRGTQDTIYDYGDAEGYEITSSAGTSYITYRDSVHHCMTVVTSEGSTMGYCMQPYMNGPSITSLTDYSYQEGLGNSTIFSALAEEEIHRWRTVYVVASKYGFGGFKADPNYAGNSNIHDGGTYGTYLIWDNGSIKAVKGLMVGGKVYEMTEGEAMALTQVIVHYVANRDSDKTLTDFKGYVNPSQTSGAFKHLKAYADYAGVRYDSIKNLRTVSELFDGYEPTTASQSLTWYIYDFKSQEWVNYTGQTLNSNHMDSDNKIKLKVEYSSKNLCNKLLVNNSSENVSVVHNYNPFEVSTIKAGTDYYDYISVKCDGDIPVSVTYNKVEAGKESITNELLNNMQYDIDTFSQTAIVEMDGMALLDSGGNATVSVCTGTGATAAPCFDESTGRYCARMFSCREVQDCLMIASNVDTGINQVTSINLEVTGSLRLNKVSARTDITDSNPCYDMTGAIYNVYAVASNQDQSMGDKVGSFQVNEKGMGMVTYSKYNSQDVWQGTNEAKNTLNKLPVGWYMVCEEAPPTNGSYLMDSEKYYVSITPDNYKDVHLVESKEKPAADPIPFEIVKECSEGANVGSASLEGAQFTVWYYKGFYDSYEEIKEKGVAADRKWIFETKVSATTNNATCIIHKELLSSGSDEPYVDENGDMILPLGTIVVEETKAPVGYKLEGATYNLINTIDGTKETIEGPYVSKIEENMGTVKLSMGNKIVVEEEPIRGDIKLLKVDKHTGEPMTGIPFLITSKTTGESHVIVTDEKGIASTSTSHIPHSKDTNKNDEYNKEEKLIPTGVWFTGNDLETMPDDSKGALPYDTYVITELPCETNKDYYLCDEIELNISEAEQLVDLGKVNNLHKPELGTDALDMVDGDKTVLTGERVSVVDKVSYQYLEIGKDYFLKGIIVNKSNGEQLLDGDKLVESYVEFVPELENGSIDVPFEFMMNLKKGEEIVVYEYLYEKETGILVASHEDITATEQTLAVDKYEPEVPEDVVEEEEPDEPEENTEEAVKSEIRPPEEEMVTEPAPKTGDRVNIFGIIGTMIISVSIVFIIIKLRKSFSL